MIVVVFGVSGAGKTTVGELLARKLGWNFIEADDFHPGANIEKMHSGRPLTDEDRWPWLERLRKRLEQVLSSGENAVLACSALKRTYRDRLRVNEAVKFVFLRANHALIEKRLRSRRDHFMDPELLQSQFDDLEKPQPGQNALTVELGRRPQLIVKEIEAKLQLAGSCQLDVRDSETRGRAAAGINNMKVAAAKAQNIRTANPAVKDPV